MSADDLSAFQKAAELLARPLSPTALEKEEAAKDDTAQAQVAAQAHAAPTPQKKGVASAQKKTPLNDASGAGRAKAKSQVAPARRCSPAGSVTSAAGAAPEASSKAEDSCEAEKAAGAKCDANGAVDDRSSGILGAVASLDIFMQEQKSKLQEPSMRKGGPPKVKRPPSPKVLSDAERNEKLSKMETQHQTRLKQALGKDGVLPDAEAADAEAEVDAVGSISGSNDGDGKGGGSAEQLRQQAEERVRARRREEAVKRKEQELREESEKKTRKAEADAKAAELEKLTKKRVQERFRAERESEQKKKEEEEKERMEREQRAEAAEDLRKQAKKRVADHDQLERQKAKEMAELEAAMESEKHAVFDAKAAQLDEKTKLRMQQRSQQTKEQAQREAEQQEHIRQEQAAAASQRQAAAELSQQRARARASEFRQKKYQEEEERMRLEEEERAREEERADAALRERQIKRQMRPDDVRLAAPNSVELPEDDHLQDDFDVDADFPDHVAAAPPKTVRVVPAAADHDRPTQSPIGHQTSHESSHPVARVPPRLPRDQPPKDPAVPLQRRVVAHASGKPPAAKAAGGGVGSSSSSRAKPPAGRGNASAKAKAEPAAPQQLEGEMPSCPVAVVVDDNTVRCTFGFIGVGDGFMDDDDEDRGQEDNADLASRPPAAAHEAAPRRPSVDSSIAAVKAAPRSGSYARPSSQEMRSQSANGRAAAANARGRKSPARMASPSAGSAGSAASRRKDANSAHAGGSGPAMQRAYSQPPPRRAAAAPRQAEAPSRASTPGSGNDAPPMFCDGYEDEANDDNQDTPRQNYRREIIPAATFSVVDAPDGNRGDVSPQNGYAVEGGLSPGKAKKSAWKQKAIKVQSADYYLDMVKAARGLNGKKVVGGAAAAGGGYAEQMRQRASDVEVQQRQEEDARMERGHSVLNRVEQRGMQAVLARSASRERELLGLVA